MQGSRDKLPQGLSRTRVGTTRAWKRKQAPTVANILDAYPTRQEGAGHSSTRNGPLGFRCFRGFVRMNRICISWSCGRNEVKCCSPVSCDSNPPGGKSRRKRKLAHTGMACTNGDGVAASRGRPRLPIVGGRIANSFSDRCFCVSIVPTGPRVASLRRHRTFLFSPASPPPPFPTLPVVHSVSEAALTPGAQRYTRSRIPSRTIIRSRDSLEILFK